MSLTEQNAQIWEGRWEEILERAEELKGRRVQLLVLPGVEAINSANNAVHLENAAAEQEKQRTLQAALEGFIGSVTGLPDDLGARSEEYFAQIMDEKEQADKAKQQVSL